MTIRLLRIAALTAAIVLGVFLPFLPGRYDSLAVPLSMMSQLIGWAGLSLVPVGVLWCAVELLARSPRKRFACAAGALAVASVVVLLGAFAAMTESVTLGVLAAGCWVYVVVRLVPHLRALATTPTPAPSALPLYLILPPVAVWLAPFLAGDAAAEFSRNRAIRNSALLIADIERYRASNGRYPLAIVSVNKDYLPGVIGIKEYRYEWTGDAYNVYFEQTSFHLGVREIVVYNPKDRQTMTSHAMDVLQLTPEQLAIDRQRGHNSVHDAKQPHWKYFWFD